MRDRLERLGAALLLLVPFVWLAWRPAERAAAGPLGLDYCREIIRCDTSYAYDECVHDIAVDTIFDGRPVREGCGDCLRERGCHEALHCGACGFDGR